VAVPTFYLVFITKTIYVFATATEHNKSFEKQGKDNIKYFKIKIYFLTT
jgi:hypothetical protein